MQTNVENVKKVMFGNQKQSDGTNTVVANIVANHLEGSIGYDIKNENDAFVAIEDYLSRAISNGITPSNELIVSLLLGLEAVEVIKDNLVILKHQQLPDSPKAYFWVELPDGTEYSLDKKPDEYSMLALKKFQMGNTPTRGYVEDFDGLVDGEEMTKALTSSRDIMFSPSMRSPHLGREIVRPLTRIEQMSNDFKGPVDVNGMFAQTEAERKRLIDNIPFHGMYSYEHRKKYLKTVFANEGENPKTISDEELMTRMTDRQSAAWKYFKEREPDFDGDVPFEELERRVFASMNQEGATTGRQGQGMTTNINSVIQLQASEAVMAKIQKANELADKIIACIPETDKPNITSLETKYMIALAYADYYFQ